MLTIPRITDALPSFVPCTLSPEDFQKVTYSSRLLLPATLPAYLVHDAIYDHWCDVGFDTYLDDPYYCDASLHALKAFIISEMFPGPSDDGSLVLHVGFLHGWLSAFALVDRTLALQGLDILVRLTDHLMFLSGRGSL